MPSGIIGYTRCPGESHRAIHDWQLCDGKADCGAGGGDENAVYCRRAIRYCDYMVDVSKA